MTTSQLWKGQYQFVPIDGSQSSKACAYTMDIERTWLGKVTGRAFDGCDGALPGIGLIQGAIRWGAVRLTWIPAAAYRIEQARFRSSGDQEAGGSALPIEFEGKLDASGRKASGEWRILTWMMENETRRKLQVIIAHGTWSMDRETAA